MFACLSVVLAVGVGLRLDVVVVLGNVVGRLAVLLMRGSVRKTGQRVLLPPCSAPLKTRITAALAECIHLGEDGCVPFNGVVIIRAVGIAPTLDVEIGTELGAVSLWDVVSFLVEQ